METFIAGKDGRYQDLMENGRFSTTERKRIRTNGGEICQFPAGCPEPNTGFVSHITGRHEGVLAGMDLKAIGDPALNAALLCKEHEEDHDEQENLHIQNILIYEEI